MLKNSLRLKSKLCVYNIIILSYSTLLDTLLSLQPQRAAGKGESKEDKVWKTLYHSFQIINRELSI